MCSVGGSKKEGWLTPLKDHRLSLVYNELKGKICLIPCPLLFPEVSQWLVRSYLLNNHRLKGRSHVAYGYILLR